MERVTMPQLGETVTEGTIVRWLKQVGDAVAPDDVLFEVSTDKIDTEVPSAHGGVLRAIVVAEGATVPIGTLVAVIAGPDEALDLGAGRSTADLGAAGSAAEPPPPLPVAAVAAPGGIPPAPPAPRPAPTGAVPTGAPAERGPFLSPVVRRLLEEHHLQPSDVVGTGAGGRITRADVLATAANRRAAPAAAAPPAATPPTLPPPEPRPDDELVPLTRARRMTAENLAASVRTSVHTLVATEVDYAALEPARLARGLSYLPFVARAVIDALGAYPHLNASLGADALHVHRRVDLGVAVDVRFEALVVPVVHDAGSLRLAGLAAAVADLAGRARSKRLTADDLTGGTFTITNVGAYGTTVTSPVITQPQVAILSTDGVKVRPVAVPDGQGGWGFAAHPVGGLSLTFDHRAVDGAYAAAFLAEVRRILETRDWQAEP